MLASPLPITRYASEISGGGTRYKEERFIEIHYEQEDALIKFAEAKHHEQCLCVWHIDV